MLRLSPAAVLAAEGQENRPEHIEGRETSRDYPDHEEVFLVRPGLAEDLVFAPEAGKGRDARQAEATHNEGCEGDRHRLAKAAHQPHVEGVRRMVDASGTKEEKRLEEGVREQVEDRGDVGASA